MPLAQHQVAFLELLVRRQALQFGSFTLKSGKQSPFFINAGRFCQGGDLAALGRAYANTIRAQIGDQVQVIFGPAYKGIALALATAQAAEAALHRPIGWAYDRKEAKDHGEGGSFVGAPLEPGTPVVLVDDVITAGTATRTIIAKLAPLQLDLCGLVVGVDRQQLGPDGRPASRAIAEECDLPVHSIVTISQAVDHLRQHPVDDAYAIDEQQAATILQVIGR